eukprot:COSAG01_NODE_59982_length_297_cov_0.691919_1_plen_46_part_01
MIAPGACVRAGVRACCWVVRRNNTTGKRARGGCHSAELVAARVSSD